MTAVRCAVGLLTCVTPGVISEADNKRMIISRYDDAPKNDVFEKNRSSSKPFIASYTFCHPYRELQWVCQLEEDSYYLSLFDGLKRIHPQYFESETQIDS
jgi:hypothetical protein